MKTQHIPTTISPDGRFIAVHDRKNARYLLLDIPKE